MCYAYTLGHGPIDSLTSFPVTTTVEPHQPWGYVQFPEHTKLFLIPSHLHMWFPLGNLGCPLVSLAPRYKANSS